MPVLRKKHRLRGRFRGISAFRGARIGGIFYRGRKGNAVPEKADETETTEAGFGETKEESQAEEAVCEAAEEETAKEAAESTSEE